MVTSLHIILNIYHTGHYSDVIMSTMLSQITGVSIVCSTVCSGADQRKHQSSASLAFVRGIHRWPMNSPHKGPVTRKIFPFDDVIMNRACFPRSWVGLLLSLAKPINRSPILQIRPAYGCNITDGRPIGHVWIPAQNYPMKRFNSGYDIAWQAFL